MQVSLLKTFVFIVVSCLLALPTDAAPAGEDIIVKLLFTDDMESTYNTAEGQLNTPPKPDSEILTSTWIDK